MTITFINHEQAMTIKKFLQKQGISHRLYQKLKILPQNFLVGQTRAAGNAILPHNAQVQLQLPPEADDPKVLTSYQPLTVIYEDDNWLVVDKPIQLSSVPGPSNRQDTLVNRIKGHLKQQHAQGLVPHLITRLDFDTQGLVLVAKNLLANSLANQQVMKHQLVKFYYARVAGTLKQDHDVINAPIGPVAGQIARHVRPDGQSAQTEYWVLERSVNQTLVKVQLHTGRTHQIRVHFASLGHPLLGDQLYGGPQNVGFSHQALQAYYLAFYDSLTHQWRHFEIPNRLILNNYG
ncbi:RluA family pseudouridine synthase [Bombilactobacillus folatiphilus]|uniref:RNA pseudouridylate synthase n=1 Tax=Bombilactobacillus folatiphilus TaxID=2923362 RepID=A0ABY4P8D4_9LACO|nr:RluA family pseudouridine synthase [Bombilactobacillus folatiphilus]UQS81877.1 RluA family pseudouridine synthase [Bombilactobacillus folatiphilus]